LLIGYARVSTHEQHLHLQIDALKEAGCDLIFTDKISGTTGKREGLDEALNAVSKGDVLVVWKLDRLARSLRHLVDIIEHLRANKADLSVITTGGVMDTTTPSGKLIFGVFALIAEFERDIISERTKAGLVAARERGRYGGRPSNINDVDKLNEMLQAYEYYRANGMIATVEKYQRTRQTIREWFKNLKQVGSIERIERSLYK